MTENLKQVLKHTATFLSLLFLLAQQPAHAQKGENLLTDKTKTEIINTFIKELKQHYIFPEVATKLEQQLKVNMQNNDYKDISDPQQFADTLTGTIKSVGNDNHLGIKYKPGQGQPGQMPSTLKQTPVQPISWNVMKDNIGYIKIDLFDDHPDFTGQIDEVLQLLHPTKALIIDLRTCRGGSPVAENYLISHFFDRTTVPLSSIFERKGAAIIEEKFAIRKDIKGSAYSKQQVYILTGAKTFSAAENFAYDMQVLKRALIVGAKTKGGANPGNEFSLGYSFYTFIPTGRSYNPVTQTNWEGVGILPDRVTAEADALDIAYTMALQTQTE